MKCAIYRSERKAETYLYLAVGTAVDDLPETLQRLFGDAEPVMMLDLTEQSRLARADIGAVRKALGEDGYFLQLPPSLPVEEEITEWITRRG